MRRGAGREILSILSAPGGEQRPHLWPRVHCRRGCCSSDSPSGMWRCARSSGSCGLAAPGRRKEQEIIQVIKKSEALGLRAGTRTLRGCHCPVQGAAANEDEDAAVPAVPHRSSFFTQIKAPAADDAGELRVPRQRYEAQALRVASVDVEAEKAPGCRVRKRRRKAGSKAHRSQTAAARTRTVRRPNRRRISQRRSSPLSTDVAVAADAADSIGFQGGAAPVGRFGCG
jgi:hypothetical protein